MEFLSGFFKDAHVPICVRVLRLVLLFAEFSVVALFFSPESHMPCPSIETVRDAGDGERKYPPAGRVCSRSQYLVVAYAFHSKPVQIVDDFSVVPP